MLTAAVVLPLAGCTAGSRPRPPAPPDPDVALRAAAVSREQALIALYESALGAVARSLPPTAVLVALHAEHVAHLAALTGPRTSPTAGRPPGATASPRATSPPTAATPGPAAPAAADLLAAEAAASAGHAVGVPTSSRRLAALLASLSAAEAAHAVALT